MPTWHYSTDIAEKNPEKTAKAMMWDAPISPKEATELARVIRGMKLTEAKAYLERVIKMEEPVPYRRYHGKVAHKRGLADKHGIPMGRYPVKAAKYFLKLLKNVEANAEFKGLEVEKLKIVHIASHKGMTIKRWMPRAFGRATPEFERRTHLEVIVEEVE
ncbi:50S ribosomal protein L22 [Ignicoccus hospitalis]|uniref:Large ribosomal subunit protein uL22 n=1 Tax=Ignicoccus hospitalis (strain KIN4/I / DSM 18386 / JCM 14125) TaxID=453591 RepID=RL22_IGNH4|nr:50S ribosomal protein L22 [Ignicoccus hospitalis]A8AA19.1 RecName: Full=Large ribosomal subunit protein uL22; AltName: Full=50S ribosomal protein L22 [Ignicoccus hospitalis KIN4/I]ABU81771.1 LSU ribosomal protein L22P [Ignicoccus hospitalis KIN4/I]HIH90039.1 50S ribosomal protein L22 [Desulfurococcaceae archaeon]